MPKDTKKKSGFLKGVGGFTGSSAIYDLLLNQGDGIATIGKALLGLKDGGRVKGVGKATHGYGKAMKKQGKK
tara:strand:+ start:280 stop:495 length:216 start_codon:yes stop_codon:yes gene_type:complete